MSIVNSEEVDSIPNKMLLINSVNENSTEIDSTSTIFSMRKIYKNLLVLSCALVLLFTAYTNMLTLQSSLNTKQNVGVNSLIINTVCVIVNMNCFSYHQDISLPFISLVRSL